MRHDLAQPRPVTPIEEAFGSPACVVRDQAENRMHAVKAAFLAALGG